ncbi:hypothetical protein [Frigoriflavimonas asaccharolytica]|uniref:Uncharacterized protein n=1 Tax=Frigoriflavimonas asaccharolytica TaxID=2735899 RepID=A0A8J8KBX6_9FLAO|nr:hypothetical protein [Frigoriflavimonas asaccharolytica]NRS93019.1 hypothetical protein [Frigoriflavimonas asaccharolytica]
MRTSLFSLLLMFVTFSSVFAQKKDEYRKAEIFMNDGTKLNILFVGYTYPNGNFLSNFATSNVYKFEYKLTEDSKIEKVDAKDVQSLTIFDDSGDVTSKIYKLDLKAINTKGELVDKSRDSFQPILYDGKLQIYGSNIFACEGNGKSLCRYAYSVFYIKNSKEQYGIMPVDFDRINLFNLGSIPEKMVEAFKYVGKDCPEFQQYLKVFEGKVVEKSYQKKMKEDYKNLYNKANEEAKKSGKSFGESQQLFGDYMLEYYLDFYKGIVMEYEKNCK